MTINVLLVDRCSASVAAIDHHQLTKQTIKNCRQYFDSQEKSEILL
jgi:hypothetical protein